MLGGIHDKKLKYSGQNDGLSFYSPQKRKQNPSLINKIKKSFFFFKVAFIKISKRFISLKSKKKKTN